MLAPIRHKSLHFFFCKLQAIFVRRKKSHSYCHIVIICTYFIGRGPNGELMLHLTLTLCEERALKPLQFSEDRPSAGGFLRIAQLAAHIISHPFRILPEISAPGHLRSCHQSKSSNLISKRSLRLCHCHRYSCRVLIKGNLKCDVPCPTYDTSTR